MLQQTKQKIYKISDYQNSEKGYYLLQNSYRQLRITLIIQITEDQRSIQIIILPHNRKSFQNTLITKKFLYFAKKQRTKVCGCQYYSSGKSLYNQNSIVLIIITMFDQLRSRHINDLQRINVSQQIKTSVQSVSTTKNHQTKILIFFLFVAFVTNIQVHGSSIFYMNPVFECQGMTSKVSEDQACSMMDFCHTGKVSTIVSELQIFCDSKKSDRTFLQTMNYIGSWVGIALAGLISDRKGRKACLCGGIMLMNIASILLFTGVQTQNISHLALSEFIFGFSNKLLYLNLLVILTRFMSKRDCETGTLAWFVISSGLSYLVLAAINEFANNWRIIYYIYTIGFVFISFFSFYLLKEDPIFLFDVGRIKQAKEIIEQIGAENGQSFQKNQENVKKLDYYFQIKMLQIEKSSNDTRKFDYTEILRRDIIIKIAIIGVVGCFYTMANRSIEMSIQNLHYSYNFNLLIIGVSNICGYFSAIWMMKLVDEKKTALLYCSFLYGGLAMLFIFPFCYQNGLVQSFLVFILRFFLCWIGNCYTRLKVDSFPEKYQITIIGIIEFISNFGSVFGPAFIQKSNDSGINPIFSVNLLRLTVGTLPLFLLSESKIELDSQCIKNPNNDEKIDSKKI